MSWLKTIAVEIWGLFVDDSGLALAALVWTAVVRLIASRSHLGVFSGPLLFVGLAIILLVSVVRGATRKP